MLHMEFIDTFFDSYLYKILH